VHSYGHSDKTNKWTSNHRIKTIFLSGQWSVGDNKRCNVKTAQSPAAEVRTRAHLVFWTYKQARQNNYRGNIQYRIATTETPDKVYYPHRRRDRYRFGWSANLPTPSPAPPPSILRRYYKVSQNGHTETAGRACLSI